MNLVRGSIQTFIVHVMIFVQSLVMIPLIVKTSGIEIYGYYTILISLLGVIYGLSSFGYGYNAMRYLPSAKTIEEKSKLFINNSRGYSLVPREFVSNKYFKISKSLGLVTNPDNIIKDKKITHIISKNENYQSNCIFKKYKHKISTHRSSRNPFNSRSKVTFYIHEVDKKKC